jgi:hypothetical protein
MEGQGGQAEAVALEHVVAQQRNALAEAKVWVLHIYLFSFPGVWSIVPAIVSLSLATNSELFGCCYWST